MVSAGVILGVFKNGKIDTFMSFGWALWLVPVMASLEANFNGASNDTFGSTPDDILDR